jgi:hypothetical protein
MSDDPIPMLKEVPLALVDGVWPEQADALVAEALRRAKRIDCFDFVPSDYQAVARVLAAVPRGRFCEWGSGMGVVTALAEMLGFAARGFEINAPLAEASRMLLADFGLTSPITTGDYLACAHDVDVVFTYCWPGQMLRVEEHFMKATPAHARLLICHGADDVRCKVKMLI